MLDKKIAIIGANSFLARNMYKYMTMEIGLKSEQILLYDKSERLMDKDIFCTKIDFSDLESIRKIDFDCDAIYVFVGKTGTVNGFKDYKSFIEVNEMILLNILNVYVEKKSKAKIIYPSTRLIYKGNLGKKLSENAEKHFNSIYAITKYASESYLKLYHNVFGVNYCILRICTPYGSLLNDNGNYGTFEFFTNQAKSGKNITVYGDGNIVKTYTHIEDICNIMVKCAFEDRCNNDVFNVGGDNMSLQEIAEIIAEKYDVCVDNINWPELDKKVDGGSTILDSSKIDVILDYSYLKLEL